MERKTSYSPATVLNPEHFFEQADRLIAPPPAGPPRQVDLRRAISAAYYGVFHAILAAAADQVIGVTKRTTSQYALVYRSIDHKTLREVCSEVKKQTLGAKYARYAPTKGFRSDIKAFAAATLELQEKRHAADYDPSIRVYSSDALLAVNTARTALKRLAGANAAQRKVFLSLLLFQPR
ncbi:MAG: hypothetical protein HY244_16435 [Rhizobiales bacterium]|nr:hypothetical protein [Hyphomicrobiales bacterium]